MVSIIILMLIAPLLSNNLSAAEIDSTLLGKKRPEIRVQYAGNLGFISVGLGKEYLHQSISLGLSYGYLPKSINGAEIHTVAIKATARLWQKKLHCYKISSYLGSAITYSIASKTYTEYPSRFPTNYHTPNAIHINPMLGVRIGYTSEKTKSKNVFLFAEVGTVDYLLVYAARNRNIKLKEIVNLSFGVAMQPK